MPGNPAVIEVIPAALSTADLLNAVAVKLPPFWPDDIETWLVQSESQFRLKGVTTSQTKFDYFVQAMSQSDAVKVLDLIRDSLTDNPYGHLKDILLRMYALTDYALYEANSSLPLYGDMLPSDLMSKLLALLPADHQACFLLHGAFLKRLPSDARAHLVHDQTSDPLSWALRADKIYQSQVSSASVVNYVSSAPEECPVLTVRAPPASPSCSQRSPTPGPCTHCSQTPSSASPCSNLPSLCCYHRNHTDQAQKCHALCTCPFFKFFFSLPSRQVIYPSFSFRLWSLCLSVLGSSLFIFIWC